MEAIILFGIAEEQINNIFKKQQFVNLYYLNYYSKLVALCRLSMKLEKTLLNNLSHWKTLRKTMW